MTKVGEHITLDIIGTTKEYDPSLYEKVIHDIAKAAKVTILNISKYKFEPQGFTILALLAESHISFHTFPEKGIISFDFFTCGKVSPSVAIDIIKKEFGILPIQITKLNGYDNINYLIKTEGESFIFKTYLATRSNFALLEAESQCLLFLQKQSNSKTPKPIPFLDASYTKNLVIHGEVNSCRLLSFLNGDFLGDLDSNKQIASSLGSFLAKLDTALDICLKGDHQSLGMLIGHMRVLWLMHYVLLLHF